MKFGNGSGLADSMDSCTRKAWTRRVFSEKRDCAQEATVWSMWSVILRSPLKLTCNSEKLQQEHSDNTGRF